MSNVNEELPAGNEEKELTLRQERFCQGYVAHGNATKAAIEAGYSTANARALAANLRQKPHVMARIQQLNNAVCESLGISEGRVMRELGRLGFSNVQNLFSQDNKLLEIHELDEETAAAIASIETEELYENVFGVRVLVGYTKKVKFWNKQAALDKIIEQNGWGAKKNDTPAKLKITITSKNK